MVAVRADHVEGGAHNKGLISIGLHDEILGSSRGDAPHGSWVNAGLYVLNTQMVRSWPSGPYDFEERLTSLLVPEQGHAFRSEARLLDIGTPECYALAPRVLESVKPLMPALDSSTSVGSRHDR